MTRHHGYPVVLLDLDGVLVDTRPVMEAAWRAVQAATGVDVPFGAYFAEIGRPFQDIMARLGLAAVGGAAERAYVAAALDGIGLGGPYPGVTDALAGLVDAGARLGVVTSKDAVRTARTLDAFDVPFAAVVCPRPGCRGKPAGDQLRAALDEMRSAAGDAVYVGDMPVDAEAAADAGVDFAHAAWGYGACPPGCRSLAAVPDLAGLAAGRFAGATSPSAAPSG